MTSGLSLKVNTLKHLARSYHYVCVNNRIFYHLRDLLPRVQLQADIVRIPEDDSFAAEKKTCHLLGKKCNGGNKYNENFNIRERCCWNIWSTFQD